MKVYLAGPMRGYPRFNFDTFLAVAARLRAHGVEVVSPAEMDLELGLDPNVANTADEAGLDVSELLLRDIQTIARPSVDGVALLDGWSRSKGATAERAFAIAIGKGVWEVPRADARDLRTLRPLVLRGQVLPGQNVVAQERHDWEHLLHEGRPA